ncbi:GNAT family N-acetyltransferase [Stomatohabitans albus]|uniref:GNAT family N-acetyltransferase n=1 Tax=Stomatohabitans albus TaxID=3110766 RepID=UPI00300C76F1
MAFHSPAVFTQFTPEHLRVVRTILAEHPWELGEQQQYQLNESASGFIGLLNEANQTYAHIRLTGQPNPVAVIEITSVTQDPDTYVEAAKHALTETAARVQGPVHLWRHRPFPVALDDLGLTLERSLAHMQRDTSDLPGVPPTPPGVLIRPFTWDDLDAFVELNNAAFAHHPDQGGWTRDLAQERLRQPWVRFDQLFIAQETSQSSEPGKLLAFHWTKQHETQEGKPAGEVYVIGVHPDAQGRGLGKVMLLTGLHALVTSGAQLLDLWVNEAETAPMRLYTSMGFTVAERSECFEGHTSTNMKRQD